MEHCPPFGSQSEPLEAAAKDFDRDGYVLLPKIVPAEPLESLRAELTREFLQVQQAGKLFAGGGTISGHLNCFPGEPARFVYHALAAAGVFDLVRKLSPEAIREPNVGCNFNLPASGFQNHHVDGLFSARFMIVNVATVKTTEVNGAIQLSCGSHKRELEYWRFVCARYPALQIEMSPGDVLVRSSVLWHRGMPNRSMEPRPMLGFTWEDGGSQLNDPFSVHGGKIKFLPNRYARNLVGRVRERAFATFPRLGGGYLFLRSLLQ